MLSRRGISRIPFAVRPFPEIEFLRPMPRSDVLLIEAVLPVKVVDVIVAEEYPAGPAAVRIPGLGRVPGQFMKGDLPPEYLAPVDSDLLDLPTVRCLHGRAERCTGRHLNVRMGTKYCWPRKNAETRRSEPY